MPSTGSKSHFVHIQDVKYILPADSIIAKLPNFEYAFSLGKQPYTYRFLACKDLSRPMILGLDFLRANRIGTDWSKDRKICVTAKRQSFG